jgi:hypothetical protein
MVFIRQGSAATLGWGRTGEEARVADQDQSKESLADLSDKLIREADAVRSLEREKRQTPISTPEYHDLADQVERRSRRIFSIAAEQETLGDEIDTSEDSIDDVASENVS